MMCIAIATYDHSWYVTVFVVSIYAFIFYNILFDNIRLVFARTICNFCVFYGIGNLDRCIVGGKSFCGQLIFRLERDIYSFDEF